MVNFNFGPVLSPGTFGRNTFPTKSVTSLSPSIMACVGWTTKGPTNFPIKISSVTDFTNTFGTISNKAFTPYMVRGFYGEGGQDAYIVRVVPADAATASVAIDASPGPTKWTFSANGGGLWGNNLIVQIQGNRNFLNTETNQWSKFNVLILKPNDVDPQDVETAEIYEKVQFSDASASDYFPTLFNDPRNPVHITTLTVGAGGTPSNLLSATITSESIGTGAPLTQRFTGTLANVPVLQNSLVIKAISKTVYNKTLAPTIGSINGSTTAFAFQVPLGDLPVVEGSLTGYYQKASIKNEITASSPDTDGSTTAFTIAADTLSEPIHREISVFKLKYAIVAGASPQTIVTVGGTAATYDLSTTPLTTTPVHPGTLSIALNLNGIGLTTIIDDGNGNLIGNNGSLPGGGTISYTAGTMVGVTAPLTATSTVIATYNKSAIITKAAQQNIVLSSVTGTPAVGDTISVGAARGYVVAVAAGNASVDVNVTTSTFSSGSATFAPSGASATAATPTNNNLAQGVLLTGSGTVNEVVYTYTYTTLAIGLLTLGDTVVIGGVTGTIVGAVVATSTTGTIDVAITAGNPATGSLSDSTTSATATVTLVAFKYRSTVNLVDLTNITNAGAFSFTTAVAPIAGTNIVLDYVDLGEIVSSIDGVLSGDVATGGTANFDTGVISATMSGPPLSGSTVDYTYQQGQFVQDNGVGYLVGDVAASGTNTINYNLGIFDVTFNTAPPSTTPITAAYVKLPGAVQFTLSGGTDGTAVSRNEISNPNLAASKKGIYALDLIPVPVNVVVPDFEGSSNVQADLTDYCDSRNNKFAIMCFANGTTKDEANQYVQVTQAWNTPNAAIYYPNIFYINENTGVPLVVPCSGFVAGVYAKTATNKNIGKAPGGTVDGALDAQGIIGLETPVDQNARDLLYQSRINPILSTDATGLVVWGVKTLSLTDKRFTYVNAPLLNNFLFYNIGVLLNQFIFENISQALFSRIRNCVDGYMSSLFRLGYFAGSTKDQAYSVVCDLSNNNAATASAGKVIVDIGFTAGTPANYIIFSLAAQANVGTL